MRALSQAVLFAFVAGAIPAAAQTIPPSEMAGRERFRFQESPGERFMKPEPYVAPRVVETRPTTTKRRGKRPRKTKPR